MRKRLTTAILVFAMTAGLALAGGIGPTMPPPPDEGAGPFDCGNYPIGFVGPIPPGCYVPNPDICAFAWVWMPWMVPFIGC